MTAAAFALILAMLAQIVWTFVAMLRAGHARFHAVRARRVGRDAALKHDAWPDDVLKVANNMNNQFETPTLFYALALLALHLAIADIPLAVLAWAYVASRIVHSLVHTGSNVVPRRFAVFFVGTLCLMAMTAWIGVRVVGIGMA